MEDFNFMAQRKNSIGKLLLKILKYSFRQLLQTISYYIYFDVLPFCRYIDGYPITDYAFEHLNVVRVEAHVFHWNIGSMRVLEKIGFHQEAILKQRAFKDSEYVDEHIFVKLKNIPK